MDIGDTLSFEGRAFSVRGFDPAGVEPRFVCLEDARTGTAISVPVGELLRAA